MLQVTKVYVVFYYLFVFYKIFLYVCGLKSGILSEAKPHFISTL